MTEVFSRRHWQGERRAHLVVLLQCFRKQLFIFDTSSIEFCLRCALGSIHSRRRGSDVKKLADKVQARVNRLLVVLATLCLIAV